MLVAGVLRKVRTGSSVRGCLSLSLSSPFTLGQRILVYNKLRSLFLIVEEERE